MELDEEDGENNQALDLLKDMLQEAVKLNGVTITSAISACTTLKSLDKGLEIPSIAVKMGLINDVLVGNSLTDMHSKCGVLEAAWKVFDCHTALDLFDQMKKFGVRPKGATIEFIEEMPIEPDSFTGAALLTACRIHGNIGLAVRAGENMLDLEQSMREHFYAEV
ncbi:pentatricopeptide repeat-containing protein [Quercus suber]|uniref:Pentatricopeptide repeat-containing protein n=1 Tax=Quercus suber TaxID=58331 RepID=A0AAW0K6L4_QUESU